MPADQYVEDVEIVARAMSALTWELASEVYRNTQRDQARVAVAALAEAGRLRQPGEAIRAFVDELRAGLPVQPEPAPKEKP